MTRLSEGQIFGLTFGSRVKDYCFLFCFCLIAGFDFCVEFSGVVLFDLAEPAELFACENHKRKIKSSANGHKNQGAVIYVGGNLAYSESGQIEGDHIVHDMQSGACFKAFGEIRAESEYQAENGYGDHADYVVRMR